MAALLRSDQLLSRFGYCSRREAVAWIQSGALTDLSGAVLSDPTKRVDPHQVLVEGKPVEFPDGLFIAFHKPPGCVCSHNPKEAPLIYALLPPRWLERNPAPETIGRLDRETTGLILLTDDGTLLHRLTSPKHEVEKTYEVTVSEALPPHLTELFAAGTLLLHSETKPCLPARLEITGTHTARLHLREGKYHQVRRMFASQDCPVTKLHRSRIGALELGDLPSGGWRPVKLEEIMGS